MIPRYFTVVALALLAVMATLPATAAKSFIDTAKTQGIPNRVIRYMAGTYSGYAGAVFHWATVFNNPEMRGRSEKLVIKGAKFLDFTLEPGITSVKTPQEAIEARNKYWKSAYDRVLALNTPYVSSSFNIGTAWGMLDSVFFRYVGHPDFQITKIDRSLLVEPVKRIRTCLSYYTDLPKSLRSQFDDLEKSVNSAKDGKDASACLSKLNSWAEAYGNYITDDRTNIYIGAWRNVKPDKPVKPGNKEVK